MAITSGAQGGKTQFDIDLYTATSTDQYNIQRCGVNIVAASGTS